jgi:signal transduction histidine kinase
MMHVDQTRFHQIMLNLLSTAAKFTRNGAITTLSEITTVKGKTYINIHVEDTGIGLSQEQLLRLFRDYSQADTSISSRFGGTGLGLALSKRLARMMGGDIFVKSTPGSGSCFTLQLPLVVADDDALPHVGNA